MSAKIHEVPAMPEPTQVSRVAPASPIVSAPPGQRMGRMPGLYGRGHELGLALQHLRGGPTNRESRIVAVRGLSGMGLSAFTNEIIEQARRAGFAVGAVAAVDPRPLSDSMPASESPAYSTLLAAFTSPVAPLLPPEAFAELGDLQERPLWLIDRVASLLRARAQTTPVLIAIDDLQWTDKASRYALMTLPSMLKLEPISWLLTSRVGDGLLGSICSAASSDMPQIELELTPLNEVAVRDLARDTLGREPGPALDRMIQGAGGMPGLLVRLLDFVAREPTPDADEALSSPVGHEVLPESFVTCLRERLNADLSPTTQAVLLAASVLGEFTIDDVAAMVGRSPHGVVGDVEALVRGGYLCDHGDRLGFDLELVRAGAYASLPKSSRQFTHRLAIKHLRDADRRATDLAPHVLATAMAGDMEAVALLHHAANEERDDARAADLLRRARALLMGEDSLRVELSASLVDRLSRGRMHGQAISEFDGCWTGLAPAPDLVVAVAPSMWEHGLQARLIEIGTRTLSGECSQLQRERLQAILTATEVYLGIRAPRSGALDGGPARGSDRGPSDTQDLDLDDLASAWSWRAQGWVALVEGRASEAAAYFGREAQQRGTVVFDEFRALLELDDLAEAGAWLRTAADMTAPAEPGAASEIRLAIAQHQLATGALKESAQSAELCVQLADPTDHKHILTAALDVKARVALFQGEFEDAPEIVTMMAEEDFQAPMTSNACLLPALSELIHGSSEAAVKLVREALEQCPHALDSVANLVAAQRVAQAGESDIELAQRLLDLAQERARAGGYTARGVADYMLGVFEKDLRLLASAAEELTSSSRPLIRALVAEDFGRVLLEAGERSRGITELDRAWDLYTNLDAHGAAENVRRVLRSAGVRRKRWASEPARPTNGWDSLTEAELRIALLVADGLSNRDVAGYLVISPNTVATHLRAVYAKLDIGKRVQLTRLVLERQLSKAS